MMHHALGCVLKQFRYYLFLISAPPLSQCFEWQLKDQVRRLKITICHQQGAIIKDQNRSTHRLLLKRQRIICHNVFVLRSRLCHILDIWSGVETRSCKGILYAYMCTMLFFIFFLIIETGRCRQWRYTISPCLHV